MMVRLFFAFLLLMATGTTKAQLAQLDLDAKYATELVKPGTMAPDFKLKTPQGKTLKLSKVMKGKYTLIDFWASWCGDCRKDMPNVHRLYRKFAPLGVQFVGISFDTEAANWQAAIEKYGIAYTQLSELKKMSESDVARQYGVKWIPSMVLVDPEGKVVLSTVLSDKMEKTLTERFNVKKEIAGSTERLTIDGSKGKLAAIIQKPQLSAGENCPMAILCHGFGGSKDGPMYEMLADSLQAHGIASIRFDFNGHGQSEGEFVDMTVPNEIEDAKQVYSYVSDLRYVSDVAIVGHSQGGVVASMTAGELGTEAFKAVVLLAPAAVLRDDAIRGSTFGASFDALSPLDPPEYVELWGGKKLGRQYILSAFSLPIYETAIKYQGPALIIHGTGDRVVPYTYGERYHHIWPKSELVILDRFDHGFSQNLYHTMEMVSDYLIKTLK